MMADVYVYDICVVFEYHHRQFGGPGHGTGAVSGWHAWDSRYL